MSNIPSMGSIFDAFRNALPSEKSVGSSLSPGSLRSRMTLRYAYSWPPPESSRDTAWLDGLRGVAAFLVMTYHFQLDWWHPVTVEMPYGAVELGNPVPRTWEFWRLPLLRLWCTSGHTQVSVFFVLSGFVLSWGPLASIRAGRLDKLAQTLGSATLRRWLRLYIPCFAISFWEFIEVRNGWRSITNKEPMDSFWAQLWDFISDCDKFALPFNLDRNNWNSLHGYDWTMWTIPYEFSGSLCIFLILLAIGRVRDYSRRTVAVGFMSFYACFEGKWSYWLFITGILLADHVRECGGFEQITRSSTPTTRLRWGIVFFIGLLLAGVPEPSPSYTTPGYTWLRSLTPPVWAEIEGGGRFWWCWAGILIILSGCHLASVRHAFDRPITRYLGRISFMVYLTHRVVLGLLGPKLKFVLFGFFGRGTFIDQPPAPGVMHPIITIVIYVCMWAIIGPVVVFVSNWCEILIDAPSTRFARWVDQQFVPPSEPADRGEAINLLPVNETSNRTQDDPRLLD